MDPVESADSFSHVQQLLTQPWVLLVQVLLLLALAHHFFAGIRFLLIDAEIGVEKTQAHMGAWLVLLAETITLSVIFYGVFW